MTIEGGPVLDKLLTFTKKLRILEGSTRSMKTWAVLIHLILYSLEDTLEIRVFRAVKADCGDAVASEFVKIMNLYLPEIWKNGKHWNKSDKRWISPKRSMIHFCGCEDEQRLHGYNQDIAYLNEVMEIHYEAYRQIANRTQGKYGIIFMDFNPSLTQHWVFNRILSRSPDRYDYMHSTYKDNPYLSDHHVAEIESTEPTAYNISQGTADYRAWQVYGLGLRCKVEGAVYERWEITDFFPERKACKFWCYGMDFGFTVDPSTLVLVALFQDELYLKEIFYQKKLTPLRHPDKPDAPCIQNLLEFNEIPKSVKIFCDKSRPEQIEDLRRCGYNAQPSKGARIEDGIQKVQKYQLKIFRNSQNLQNEAENYAYKEVYVHKKKRIINKPIDEWNHCLDAVRYAVEGGIYKQDRNFESEETEESFDFTFASEFAS